jgi:hypothetical protein
MYDAIFPLYARISLALVVSTSRLVRPKVEDTAKERLEVVGWSETIPNKENNGTYFHDLTNN